MKTDFNDINIKGVLFVLIDENKNDKSYCFETNIDDLDDVFLESDELYNFRDIMETADKKWSGVHDGTGGENWIGYSSYEIRDFDTAIKKWYDFFKLNNKLPEKSFIFVVNSKNFNKFEEGEIDINELIKKKIK